MTTLDAVNVEALYVPGLRFWGQARHGRVGIVAQNANGAVELWHAAKDRMVGAVLAHSPSSREGYEHTSGCTVLGGTCYSRESYEAYTHDFLPLLCNVSAEAVLKQLADWHDAVFRQAVTA